MCEKICLGNHEAEKLKRIKIFTFTSLRFVTLTVRCLDQYENYHKFDTEIAQDATPSKAIVREKT